MEWYRYNTESRFLRYIEGQSQTSIGDNVLHAKVDTGMSTWQLHDYTDDHVHLFFA